MKHIFIVNRFSLRERLNTYTEILKEVAKELKLDYKIEINDEEHSTEDILDSYKNKSCIIYAVGGDGILNRVINAIYGTKNKVACIPAGTGNDFNRSINEFFDEGNNLVDLVKCNDKYFVNVACFGVDADIANDNKIVHNKFIPRDLQYKTGIVKHILMFKPYSFEMKWDNNTINKKLALVTVCNGGYYGGGFHINPDGVYNDGKIDIFVSYATNRRELIKYLIKLLKGEHLDYDKVEHIVTDNFTIINKDEIEGNLDGESLRDNKFEMNVIPKAITFYNNKKLIKKINDSLGK